MKIKELLAENGNGMSLDASSSRSVSAPRQPKPAKERIQRVPVGYYDPNYTPGKAALDNEYHEVEDFTKTTIPHIQKKLDDPRN